MIHLDQNMLNRMKWCLKCFETTIITKEEGVEISTKIIEAAIDNISTSLYIVIR